MNTHEEKLCDCHPSFTEKIANSLFCNKCKRFILFRENTLLERLNSPCTMDDMLYGILRMKQLEFDIQLYPKIQYFKAMEGL